MKTIIRTFLALFVFCPVFAFAQAPSIPEDVLQYYESSNFVAAFSTFAERSRLVAYESVDSLPRHLKTERLRKVYHHLKQIKIRELGVDYQMLHPKGLRRMEVPYQAVFQIARIHAQGKGYLKLDIHAYGLNSKTNAMLIADYERGKETFSWGDFHHSKVLFHKEIHEWFRKNGQWFKKYMPLVLIEN